MWNRCVTFMFERPILSYRVGSGIQSRLYKSGAVLCRLHAIIRVFYRVRKPFQAKLWALNELYSSFIVD